MLADLWTALCSRLHIQDSDTYGKYSTRGKTLGVRSPASGVDSYTALHICYNVPVRAPADEPTGKQPYLKRTRSSPVSLPGEGSRAINTKFQGNIYIYIHILSDWDGPATRNWTQADER